MLSSDVVIYEISYATLSTKVSRQNLSFGGRDMSIMSTSLVTVYKIFVKIIILLSVRSVSSLSTLELMIFLEICN